MLAIKVLGPGCANCHRVAEIVEEAVAEMGLEVEIEMVSNRAEFARYNLLATPGLVIDEKLVSGGRIPGLDEVKALIGRTTAVGV
jgi:small redox-active disulfide protein 2